MFPIDDVWARDSGPTFVVDANGGLQVTDWNFNGWGGRFDHAHDHEVSATIADRLGVPRLKPRSAWRAALSRSTERAR